MIEGRFNYLFRSRYNGPGPAKGSVYIGIHSSSDPNFGSERFVDPYIGMGDKVKALVNDLKNRGFQNIRAMFDVEIIVAGTFEQCKHRLDQIDIPYDHALSLNSRIGAVAGVPKSEEHKAAIGAANETAQLGNTNATGGVHELIDESLRKIVEDSNKVFKWINEVSTGKNKLTALDKDADGNLIVPEGFALGKSKKAKV